MACNERGHRNRPAPSGRGGERPTWLVVGAIHGGWLLFTVHAAALPWRLRLPAGAFIVCRRGSLRHETAHGHPTRSPRVDLALA